MKDSHKNIIFWVVFTVIVIAAIVRANDGGKSTNCASITTPVVLS